MEFHTTIKPFSPSQKPGLHEGPGVPGMLGVPGVYGQSGGLSGPGQSGGFSGQGQPGGFSGPGQSAGYPGFSGNQGHVAPGGYPERQEHGGPAQIVCSFFLFHFSLYSYIIPIYL